MCLSVLKFKKSEIVFKAFNILIHILVKEVDWYTLTASVDIWCLP